MAKQDDQNRGWNRSAGELEYQELLRQYADQAPASARDASEKKTAEEKKGQTASEEKSTPLLDKLLSGGGNSGKGKYYKKKPRPAAEEPSGKEKKNRETEKPEPPAQNTEASASAVKGEASGSAKKSGAEKKSRTPEHLPSEDKGPEVPRKPDTKEKKEEKSSADPQKTAGKEPGKKDSGKSVSTAMARLKKAGGLQLPDWRKLLKSPEKEKNASLQVDESSLGDWLYNECYFIGIQLMRDGTSFRRRSQNAWKWLSQKVPAFAQRHRRHLLRLWEDFSDASLSPFREISKKTSLLSVEMRRAQKEDPQHPVRSRLSVFGSYLHSLGRPLNRIANFIAPIIGITILAATITYFSDITFALRLTYPNEDTVMGYIADENVFYEARNKVLERLIGEEYMEPEDSGPGFTLAIVSEDSLMDPETLANQLISASGNEIENADGIYIEDKFLGAVRDGSEFLLYIDSVLDNYRSGEEHELVQFVKKITLRSGVYPTSSVKSLHDIKEYLDSDVPYEETHVVAEGETLESIAETYDTTTEQLVLLNPDLEERLEEDPDADVEEGEELLVSQTSLTLGIQVTRREEYTEDVPYGDTKVENDQLPAGYTEVISNGIPGEQLVTADITYIDGEKVAENRISVERTKEPVNRKLKVGTKPLLQYLPAGSDTSGSFLWPVDGGYISAGLYGYYGHTGTDIAANAGTIVRACRAGYVTYASNISIWPYGKRVDLNHMDGFTSRYAHMSTVVVASGTYVEQGQIIGYVGRTGNATGNHLHLEIRLNGVIMDPAKYIGTYYPGR